MNLEIGKEYIDREIDFLTKKIVGETTVKYLGRHPYDNRHMFAMKPIGTVYAPDESEFIDNLVSA